MTPSRSLAALVLTALLLAGCGSAAAPAASSQLSSSASTAAKTHMVASYSSIASTVTMIWVTKDAGLFEKHGLDVDFQYIASATSVPALISGQVNIAAVGGSEVLSAVASGADLVIVTTDTPVYPYIFEVAPGLQNPADLKGKSIGISRFGSSSDLATRAVLKKFGMDADKDVALIQTGSTSERMAAMKAGTIQAGVAQPPDTIEMERQGWRPLVDLASQNIPAPTLVHAVQRTYRNSNRDAIQRYVDALVEGIARMRRDRAFSIQTLRKYMKVDDEQALNAAYEYGSKPELTPSLPYPRVEQYAETLAILGEKNEKLAKLDVAGVLDPSFVKSAEDRGLAK